MNLPKTAEEQSKLIIELGDALCDLGNKPDATELEINLSVVFASLVEKACLGDNQAKLAINLAVVSYLVGKEKS